MQVLQFSSKTAIIDKQHGQSTTKRHNFASGHRLGISKVVFNFVSHLAETKWKPQKYYFEVKCTLWVYEVKCLYLVR